METWKNPDVIALWIGIAIAFTAFLILMVVLLTRAYVKRVLRAQKEQNEAQIAHQRELLESNILVQESERRRIASDLHDDLIGKLYQLKLTAPRNRQAALEEVITTARNISHDISPPLINYTDVPELFEDILNTFTNAFQVQIFTNIEHAMLLSEEERIQCLRIFNELLVNVQKHANATSLQLTMRQTENTFSFALADNGVGFDDSSKHHKGIGLRSIESRVHALNAEYKIKHPKDGGSVFIFSKKHATL